MSGKNWSLLRKYFVLQNFWLTYRNCSARISHCDRIICKIAHSKRYIQCSLYLETLHALQTVLGRAVKVRIKYGEPLAKLGLFCKRLCSFSPYGLRNMHFSAVALTKLKFCKSFYNLTRCNVYEAVKVSQGDVVGIGKLKVPRTILVNIDFRD